ncbi:hypothetical protein EsH8_I_000400 [Colletotrichum jinshuiense]
MYTFAVSWPASSQTTAPTALFVYTTPLLQVPLQRRDGHQRRQRRELQAKTLGRRPAMAQLAQNVTSRYLKKASLQRLLERLFPGQTDFSIEMRDDVWHFKAPKEVDSQRCFVDEITEPVGFFEVKRPSSNGDDENAAPDVEQFFTGFRDLGRRLDSAGEDYTYRYISICQRNSWRPLQITSSMLELLIERLGLDESLWDLTSCFYTRNMDVEEVFCMPYTERRRGSVVEASYTFRYPEHKPDEDRWVIRQSGIYQRFDLRSRQSLFILISPAPNSKANQRAVEWLARHSKDAEPDPVWLHKIVHETYLPSWRSYVAWLERQFLPMAHKTFATFIEEPSTLKSSHLTTLASLENRFLQIPAILASSEDVLRELSALCAGRTEEDVDDELRASCSDFENFRRKCGAFSRTATYLHQRAQTTAQLLANTLSFREQLDTRKQNDNMLRLNKSVVFITTLTLLYLPPSFIATFFGMNFFDLDTEENRIVGTSMIWIYITTRN